MNTEYITPELTDHGTVTALTLGLPGTTMESAIKQDVNSLDGNAKAGLPTLSANETLSAAEAAEEVSHQ